MRQRLAMRMGLIILGFALTPPLYADNILISRHNLGSTPGRPANAFSGGSPANSFDGTAEVCVFCHTPHGGDTAAAVPLWNRVNNNPAVYADWVVINDPNFSGNVAPVGSVSIACLSCHDGTQAMDTVVNAPGSGGFSPTGQRMAGVWSGADQNNDGVLTAAVITQVGTNLGMPSTPMGGSDEHPFGMQYAAGGVSASNPIPAQGTTNDPTFRQVSHRLSLSNRNVWWLDANGNGQRDMLGDILLYTRAPNRGYAGQIEEEPFVECPSCHNAHAPENGNFLRIGVNASRLCLACHTM